MPHKQPQPCETGCCEQDTPCTCIDAKNSFNGTYTTLSFTGGAAPSGPYPAFSPLHTVTEYTFPGVADDSTTLDFTNNTATFFCYEDVGGRICGPSPATLQGFFVCDYFATEGSWMTIAAGYPDLVLCPPVVYYGGNRNHVLTYNGSVEWFCDAGGNYRFRISYSIFYTFMLVPVTGSSSCRSLYDPGAIIAANDDGSFTLEGGQSGPTSPASSWLCRKNDSNEVVYIRRSGQYYTVQAWGWTDSVDGNSVTVWNQPYNPLGWLQGTVALA